MALLRNPIVLIFCAALPACGQQPSGRARMIQALIEPAELSTLGERGANSRVQKTTAILWKAKPAGEWPVKVAAEAVNPIG